MRHVISVLFSCIILFATSNLCQAQVKDAVFQHQGQDLKLFVSKNLRYPAEIRNKCMSVMTLAKFRVNSSGNIDTISFSKGTPSSICLEITRTINLTSGQWKPQTINGKSVISRSFILPFQFWQIECNTEENLLSLKTDFLNLLNFGDDTFGKPIDAIFLEPVTITAYPPRK